MNRRSFLQSAAMAAASGSRSYPASDKVNIAVMGVRGRGRNLTGVFCGLPDVNISYFCEVDPRVIPRVSKIVEDAKAYKSRVVAEAQGEAQRFVSVYTEYEKDKDVTRQRLFLETLEDVLAKSNKVIIEEGKDGPGVVPYLPLPELQKRQNAPARTATTGAAQ